MKIHRQKDIKGYAYKGKIHKELDRDRAIQG